MLSNPLIPTPEAIPAPAWIFHILGVALFAVHLLLMNVLVGGTAIALAGRLRNTRGAPLYTDALAGKLPTFFALTVTMGIALLLFLQVIYGNLFYTSHPGFSPDGRAIVRGGPCGLRTIRFQLVRACLLA
jgi:hypothetical protein